MNETRTVCDPFLGKDVEVSDRLVDRLRGKYACGPTMENGEPEFGWQEHPTPPIQHEAANKIVKLEIDILSQGLTLKDCRQALTAMVKRADTDGYETPEVRAACTLLNRIGWGDQ